MGIEDEAAEANRRLWESEVEKGCGYTTPWLDLDAEVLRRFAAGELEPVPEPLADLYPGEIFRDVEGERVLCLASGGGQQSAVFGLLGARVAVVDFAEGQLEGDRRAARHYGYEVEAVRADMRDLSRFERGAFRRVYQAESLAYVPSAREVYRQVARVLEPGGLYRVPCNQPVAFATAWDGEGYRIETPYAERIQRRDDGGIEFRHDMSELLGGLVESGFRIERVTEAPYAGRLDPRDPPGSWNHERAFVGGAFAVIARREG